MCEQQFETELEHVETKLQHIQFESRNSDTFETFYQDKVRRMQEINGIIQKEAEKLFSDNRITEAKLLEVSNANRVLTEFYDSHLYRKILLLRYSSQMCEYN